MPFLSPNIVLNTFVFRHTYFMLFLKLGRYHFTPVQNNWQNYWLVHHDSQSSEKQYVSSPRSGYYEVIPEQISLIS
jgi:hypothetical protein